MNAGITYHRLHLPTTWLVVLIVALMVVALELALIGAQRNAPAAPSAPTPVQTAPTPTAPMSGYPFVMLVA